MQRICLKLQGFFQHLTPNQGAPSSPPGRNTSRLALPKSEWQLQIRIWAHHLKYKLRLEAKAIRKKKSNKTTCCQGCCEHQCPGQEGSCWWGIDWVHLQWPSFKIHCDHGLVQEFQKNPGAHSLPLANTITKTFPFTASWPAIPSASTNPWPISSIASGRSSQIAPSGWGTPFSNFGARFGVKSNLQSLQFAGHLGPYSPCTWFPSVSSKQFLPPAS